METTILHPVLLVWVTMETTILHPVLLVWDTTIDTTIVLVWLTIATGAGIYIY